MVRTLTATYSGVSRIKSVAVRFTRADSKSEVGSRISGTYAMTLIFGVLVTHTGLELR